MGNSGSFGSKTTAFEVVEGLKIHDSSDKVVIVTGSNTGIGKETARALLKAGFGHVVIAARDVEKLKLAKKDLLQEFPTSKIYDLPLDLGDSKNIESFVTAFEKLNLPGLHVLVNNAGVCSTPQWETKDGYEYQNGINHLGTFRLTLLLLPVMAKTKGEKRIINVSSDFHYYSPPIDFDDFHLRKPGRYGSISSYQQSKLCNVLFTIELDRRLAKIFKKEEQDHFICCAIHPGTINTTEALRNAPLWQQNLWKPTTFLFTKSKEQGAATTVFAVLSPTVKGGEYLSDCETKIPSAAARDEKLQYSLFEFSLKETKISFPQLI